MLFQLVNGRKLGRGSCFLCGKNLIKKNMRSDEHVFPKWILRRFDLWDHKLILSNRSKIAYRYLKIPCCRTCNNTWLSKVETRIKKAIGNGNAAVRRIPKQLLLVWLGKILYGLIYKENILKTDLTGTRPGVIVPNDFLSQFRTHHLFMQAARIHFIFKPDVPASFFIYKVQCPMQTDQQFDFYDLDTSLSIAIRLGSLGIIGILQDGGAQAEFCNKFYKKLHKHTLHPIQFAEVVAHAFYCSMLLNRIPKFIHVENKGSVIATMFPLAGFSSKPIFNIWKMDEYAKVLAHIMKVPLNEICAQDSGTVTWLFRDDGTFNTIAVN